MERTRLKTIKFTVTDNFDGFNAAIKMVADAMAITLSVGSFNEQADKISQIRPLLNPVYQYLEEALNKDRLITQKVKAEDLSQLSLCIDPILGKLELFFVHKENLIAQPYRFVYHPKDGENYFTRARRKLSSEEADFVTHNLFKI